MTRTELIAALEAAEGPSRDLDIEIHKALGHDVILGAGKHPMNRTGGGRVPRYTESIDAALSFTPEGWHWRIESAGDPYAALSFPQTPWEAAEATALAATPAIALCIANLRALETQND